MSKLNLKYIRSMSKLFYRISHELNVVISLKYLFDAVVDIAYFFIAKTILHAPLITNHSTRSIHVLYLPPVEFNNFMRVILKKLQLSSLMTPYQQLNIFYSNNIDIAHNISPCRKEAL